MPSSPLRALVDQLGDLDLQEVPNPQRVLAALHAVPDPRKPRGIRHPITGILVIAVCAVASGARSFAAMAEWAADTAAALLAQIGVGTPDASTIRRTLSRMDAESFDAALGRWAQACTEPLVVAVDRQGGPRSQERWRSHSAPALGCRARDLGGAVPGRGRGQDQRDSPFPRAAG